MAKQEYAKQTEADAELHRKIAVEREQAKYQKHHDMCSDITDQIVEYSVKFAEYRELTEK